MTVPPWKRLFPTQPFNAELFTGNTDAFEQAICDTIARVTDVRAPRESFQIETTDQHQIEEMASIAVALSFLTWLIGLIGARRVLEIGTFVGVSAMYFSRALPAGGKVVTLEKFNTFAQLARRNIAANGLSQSIEVLEGDAIEVLPTLVNEEPFDFVFIDGNKERYAQYVDLTTPLVREGGILAVDDAFFHGDALNLSHKTEKGLGVRACLDSVTKMKDWNRALLPISNGLLLMTKARSAVLPNTASPEIQKGQNSRALG